MDCNCESAAASLLILRLRPQRIATSPWRLQRQCLGGVASRKPHTVLFQWCCHHLGGPICQALNYYMIYIVHEMRALHNHIWQHASKLKARLGVRAMVRDTPRTTSTNATPFTETRRLCRHNVHTTNTELNRAGLRTHRIYTLSVGIRVRDRNACLNRNRYIVSYIYVYRYSIKNNTYRTAAC